jgi:hypothetical protein
MDGWGGEVRLSFFFFLFCFCICTIPHSIKETSESDGGVLVEGVVRLFTVSCPRSESIVVVHTFVYSSSLTSFARSHWNFSMQPMGLLLIRHACLPDLAGSECMYQYRLRPAMWLSEHRLASTTRAPHCDALSFY